MIHDALLFLKTILNDHLHRTSGSHPDEAHQEKVVFIRGDKMEPLEFDPEAVSMLLINVEEEKTLRQPDRYVHVTPDGARQKVYPEIKLNVFVLFVAHFTRYEESLRYLSRIIQYFQRHPVFNGQNTPTLSDRLDPLNVDLITLPFAEQNEVWNALRTTYHPSLLYKVKMVVFQDEGPDILPEMQDMTIDVRDPTIEVTP